MADSSIWRRHSLSQMLLVLSLFTSAVMSQQILQAYCSNQNTGSDNEPREWMFMSLGYCQTACQENYAFAVVQYKTCWCSDYAPFDTVDVSNCNSTCPGFPYEYCGLDNDLFGYVQLHVSPSGTLGAPTNPPDTTTEVIISTINPSTVYLTSVNTVVTTEIETAAPTETLASTPAPATSIATHIITSLILNATDPPAALTGTHHNGDSGGSKISGGAIAGIVIGALAGLALLGALVWYCCRPRRDQDGNRTGLNRNTSVLSKVGLLRNQTTSAHHSPYGSSAQGGPHGVVMSEQPGLYGHPPRLDTKLPTEFQTYTSGGPSSAATSDSRRGSRPLFVDQRLNPYALTSLHHQNASRSSIGTLEDNQDYSRPLEVKNPDPT